MLSASSHRNAHNTAFFWTRGKLLFCAADLLAARLAADVVTLSGGSGRSRLLALRVSLFNPLTFVISSRGSCDALLAMLLLACLKAALQGRAVACGAWLGAAAHFRVYPVAHAVPLALFFCLSGSPQPGVHSRWSLRRRVFPAFAFLASSALCFALLGAACFAAYGAEFIREAYLYHVGRSDPRHNFSPSFYTAYLRTTPSPVASPPPSSSFTSMLRALVAALPQASVVTAAGAAFARDPPAALFLQTFFFVAFNSVVTAQYFAWWACLAPLLLPALTDGHVAGGDADTLALFSTQRRPLVGAVTAAAAAWVAALAYWLSRAALLEFGVVGNEEHVGTGGPRLSSSTLFDVDGGASGKHDDEYAPVWRASLLFVWASILFGATMARALPARDLVGVAAPRHIKAA